MEKEYVTISQGDVILYSISLSVEELISHTTVEYYSSETGEGYQRPLVPSHYRNIASYLRNPGNPVLPTAILTAVNPDQIIEGSRLRIKGKLRVVDGQHRIEGLRYLKEVDKAAYEKIREYTFPALVMRAEKDQKMHEINAFININKAGKPVSTDLAIELREKIRKDNFELTSLNLNLSISTRVTQDLTKRRDSIWFDLIKLGDEEAKGKSISINAFYQSILGIVDNYITLTNQSATNFDEVDDLVEELTLILTRVWDIIAKRWVECFEQEKLENIKLYNIQKGIGVYSLHTVFSEVMEIVAESKNLDERNIEKAIKNFGAIIKKSQVIDDDWIIGGIFSTYNSRSGFKKISRYITNEENLER